MADAENQGRINIWRNSIIAASAAAAERGAEALGRMSIYRNTAIARSRRHHEVPAGGGAYSADAVHFDGETRLGCNALSCTDNGFFSFSFWIKASAEAFDAGGIPWVADPDTYASWAQMGGATAGFGSIDITTSDNGSNTGLVRTTADGGAQLIPVDTWSHVIGSLKTTATQVAAIYIDGAIATGTPTFSGAAFNNAYNGLEFLFGDDGFGDGMVADIADVWIAPGVSILTGAEISPSTLALFRDPDTGKPVNPSGFPAGGAILFSGNAAGFATNQGSGGAFALIGSLSNATTSPSG